MTNAEQNLKDKLTPDALNALYEYIYDDHYFWEVQELVEDLYELLGVKVPWLDSVTPIDKLDDQSADCFKSINEIYYEEMEIKQKKIIEEKKKLTDTIETEFGNFEL